MPEEPRLSNWLSAEQASYPRCPQCGAHNRPRAQYIEWIGGRFYCTVCSATFDPPTIAD